MATALDKRLHPEDWLHYRKRSLIPGGFGEERKLIWPKLLFVNRCLNTSSLKEEQDTSVSNLEEHRDERQIRLDTDRSFVMYPDPKDRESLQEELRQLLVSVFRRRPKLHYFQGFHDIATVLLLTLPQELQLECVEKLSLHRLRDSMGPSLEPVLGLLRFMQALLRVVDPDYAATLEQNTPLPYFALSNLLTLFSHDMPTLPLIQHVFDYLLCRPPIMVVYLVTAITLSRKAEVKRLQDEGEDGMLHSLLASLPHFTDSPTGVKERDVLYVTKNEPNGLFEPSGKAEYLPLEVAQEDVSGRSPAVTPSPSSFEQQSIGKVEPQSSSDEESGLDLTDIKDVHPGSGIPCESPPTRSSSPTPPILPPKPDSEGREGAVRLPVTESDSLSSSVSPSATPTPPLSPPPPSIGKPLKPAMSLIKLLEESDSLYQQYPPNHSEFGQRHKLSAIMGPQSVIFTWSQDEHEIPSDDMAERMVDYPQLVVYPAVEDDEDREGREDTDEKSGFGGKKRNNKLRKGKHPGRARKRLGKVLEFRDRKTMVAGAVLVLGVAMAVYGVRSGAIGVGGTRGHSGFNREWKKVSGWVGSVVRGSRFW
ncbi:hypothetical protein L218DRAFT_973878 [Marasmius fiardii PR-910]|nr:hypothetical protein L218DRAFT_973878 [Marasmius fiardii PR-910]